MDKHELTRRLARRAHQSQGNAADTVDTLIYDLLKDTCDSKDTPLPAQLLPVPLGSKGTRRSSSSAPAKES